MKQNNNDKQYGGQAGGQPGRYVISGSRGRYMTAVQLN